MTSVLRLFKRRFPRIRRFIHRINSLRKRQGKSQIIGKSGLFDPRWYLEQYPDVAEADIDPLTHYTKHGWREGRNPSSLFDSQYYLSANPDVAAAQTDPLLHYLQYGQAEGRQVRPLDLAGALPKTDFQLFIKQEIEQNYAKPPARRHYESNRPAKLGDLPIKLLAYYLPQFYPTPDNDEFWGKGFTEWTNVTRSRPLFAEHYQPRLPDELGFYDLRIIDNLKNQARLAREHGLAGFCFYRYWFEGRTVLEEPLELLFEHKEVDIEYCIFWTNTTWTRNWEGLENEVLIEQRHSPEDDLRFIADAERFFQDERYIRIDNKPVLMIYHIGGLPDPSATAQRWRTFCQEKGYDGLYLIAAHTFNYVGEPDAIGFDAIVQFPPHRFLAESKGSQYDFFIDFEGGVYEYEDFATFYLSQKAVNYTRFLTVCPAMWDNTPRWGKRAVIMVNGSPQKYGNWLRAAIERTIAEVSPQERLVFINAWNEWGEGVYLEPDRKYGYAYLNATSEVLASFSEPNNASSA